MEKDEKMGRQVKRAELQAELHRAGTKPHGSEPWHGLGAQASTGLCLKSRSICRKLSIYFQLYWLTWLTALNTFQGSDCIFLLQTCIHINSPVTVSNTVKAWGGMRGLSERCQTEKGQQGN